MELENILEIFQVQEYTSGREWGGWDRDCYIVINYGHEKLHPLRLIEMFNDEYKPVVRPLSVFYRPDTPELAGTFITEHINVSELSGIELLRELGKFEVDSRNEYGEGVIEVKVKKQNGKPIIIKKSEEMEYSKKLNEYNNKFNMLVKQAKDKIEAEKLAKMEAEINEYLESSTPSEIAEMLSLTK